MHAKCNSYKLQYKNYYLNMIVITNKKFNNLMNIKTK